MLRHNSSRKRPAMSASSRSGNFESLDQLERTTRGFAQLGLALTIAVPGVINAIEFFAGDAETRDGAVEFTAWSIVHAAFVGGFTALGMRNIRDR